MAELFTRAYDLALRKPNVVETTKTGILSNALSHLTDVTSKHDFCCKMARGLGAT